MLSNCTENTIGRGEELMQFNIDKFFDRIQEEVLSKQEVCQAVSEEIKEAENQKISFVDQASENPEYFKFICNQIDCYILYLNVLKARIEPQCKDTPDDLEFDTDQAMTYYTMKLLLQLDQFERKKRSRV